MDRLICYQRKPVVGWLQRNVLDGKGEKKKKRVEEDNVRVYSQTDAFLRCQSVNPVNEGLESLLPSN